MGKKKPKLYPDAVPTSIPATTASRRRCHKSKRSGDATAKTVRPTPMATRFDGTCNGLKYQGLFFDRADSRDDQLYQVKRDIVEYIGK